MYHHHPFIRTLFQGLHWTNWPRSEELQLTFRFTFLLSALPELNFRQLIDRYRLHHDAVQSAYAFEWIDGVLLRFDPVIGHHVRSLYRMRSFR